MIKFELNGRKIEYTGDEKFSLLNYLREEAGIFSAKDGCSGQGACGACLVELNGRPALACVTLMKKVAGGKVITLEGLPDELRRILGNAFVEKGAVQCGFCTPGFLMRAKILLQKNPRPSRQDILDSLKLNLCRCTGYVKIVEAIEHAAKVLAGAASAAVDHNQGIGGRQEKYEAWETAIGRRPFVADLRISGMVYGALKFCDHARARIKRIDTGKAEKMPGVIRVFTAADIPGERLTGLIVADWPLMVRAGEISRSGADVLAGVAAASEAAARAAVQAIRVEYEILEPLTDMLQAENSPVRVHEKGNLLETCRIRRGGDVDNILAESVYVASGLFRTQMIEHAFLETEASVSLPEAGGVRLYSQGQGVYEDRRQVASLLGLPLEKVRVIQVANGGGFGGKEDITTQGHAALFAFLLQKPVRVRLSRPESMRMHPKRHPLLMEYALGCDGQGKLTALRARLIGDTGAYASVGTKVLERAAGHASGAYHVPAVDIEAKTVYTNNLPCGAMRGFGVNQVTFAMESCVDMLCEKGGFDRWQFRYNNALCAGRMTATGQVLRAGVGVRATLLALRDEFFRAKTAGLACGIKNTGIGNSMVDDSVVKIEIVSASKLVIQHGWTEMGQGVHTVARQVVCQETGLDPKIMEVRVDTASGARSGMTTASRATSLVGNALIDACAALKRDLGERPLAELAGKVYEGRWRCDWTTTPQPGDKTVTHYSYGYASQLVVLDEKGRIASVHAAHDAGRIVNPTLFEGQIQGAVVMGLGYALSEDLPLRDGLPASTRLADLGLLKAHDVPPIRVIGVEVADEHGPYGAKGVGEIGLVPTAAAVANALFQYDGVRRFQLPMKRVKEKK
ncbi:MAG: selenium-dependent xanthine dehydrogenase [Candidatus Aminicenantes bacterium]|nr:selenium-dependent xanthine dehydrogenase [Candidatus Aminicenantes bacterium]